jgi:DNA-binding GntR family transcriptional regulator
MTGGTGPVPGRRAPRDAAEPTTELDAGPLLERRRMTAQQIAYEILRQNILRGSLRPDTRLLQAEIAAQLGLSTTPVREALQRLASEGLVRIGIHRGAVVRGLNVDELTEIYELRMVLEPLAIRKAALRITPAELQRAEKLCTKMEALHDDAAAWTEANRDFHAILAEAAHSPYLIEMLQGLRDKAMPYVRLSMGLRDSFPDRAEIEHRQLLEACRNRAPEAAAEIELQHLAATRDLTMAAVRPESATADGAAPPAAEELPSDHGDTGEVTDPP